MAMKKIELGQAGVNVARNVRLYRQERGFAYGRDIPPFGLRLLEDGKRRVDVDDLVALSHALAVGELALLLPHHVPVATVGLRERGEVTERIVRVRE